MTSTTRGPRRRAFVAVICTVAAVVAVTATAQAVRPASDASPEGAPEAASDTEPGGASDPSPVAQEGGVVPWMLRLAPQQAGVRPRPEAAQAAPCRADDVSITIRKAQQEPARDGRPAQLRATLVLTNEGSTCSLTAEAQGVLLDENGDRLPASNDGFSRGPAYAPPPPLEPGVSASAPLTWTSWCGDDPGRWSVSLELDEGWATGVVPGDDPPVPPCMQGSSDALYGFGPWTVLNSAGQPAHDPQSALTATVTGPDAGRLGEVLPMVLRLTNPTRGPIALDPCPGFTWSVSSSGPGSFLRSSPPLELNCPAAPREVAADRYVEFELELELELSPALADGMLRPGEWWVHAAIADSEPRRVTVLPAQEPEGGAAKLCTWVVPPDAEPRVPGVPPSEAPRTMRQAIVRTNRGDLTLELDGRSWPCAVQSFVHQVEGGYWDGQRCYLLSTQTTFRNVDCGSPELSAVRAGFAFPSEARADSSYPAGTVVLTHNETIPHTGSIRILYGDAPTYAHNFTVLGRITRGLEVVEQVAAGGQEDGEFSGPRLELKITAIELRP